jgi:hypothetical protein
MRIFSNHSKRLLSLGALVLPVLPSVANRAGTYANPICAAGQIPLNPSSTVLSAPSLNLHSYTLTYPACYTEVLSKVPVSNSWCNTGNFYVSNKSVQSFQQTFTQSANYNISNGVNNDLKLYPIWTAALKTCRVGTLYNPIGWATCTAAQKSAGALNCP